MARQLRRAARGTGQAIAAHEGLVRMIRDWERGAHQLTERYELLYAAALGIEPDQLVRGPDGSRDPHDAAGYGPVTRVMFSTTREDEYQGRLDHVLAHPEVTDLIAVTQLREHVRRLDERYDSFPASALIAEAGRRLGQIEFLAVHALRSDVRRELRGAEAEAALLMGQLVWDASQRRAQDAATTYLRQAVDAARQRGDHACEGLALLRSSMVDLYGRKDPRSGLQVAQQAVTAGGRVSKVLAGLATLHTAEAHAMQGDQADCEKALGQAETHLRQITPEDPAIVLYSGTQFGRMAGSCYLFLGNAATAASVLEQTALTLRDGSKAEAIVLANLALARIRLGRIDEAVAALHKTLDVVEVNWGGGGLNIAFTAGRELRGWQDTTAVRDVRDRLLVLMSEV
jgi:tetratricopeptide (TPR) repeat protein